MADEEDDESSSNSSTSSGSGNHDAVMEGSSAPPPSSLSNLFGEDDDDDDDDDDDEDDNDESDEEKEAAAPATYEENDSDAEFDDAHAEIVGLSRPEGSEEQLQLSSSNLGITNRAFDEGQEQQQHERSESYYDMNPPEKSRNLSTTTATASGAPQSRASMDQLQYLVPPKTLSVPDIPRPFVVPDKGNDIQSKRITLHMTKLPNTLAIIHSAYDHFTYDPHEEEELYGSSTLLSNIIRWRYAKDADGALRRDPHTGKLVRESNARIIQWSDGSKSIQVGEELMDLEEQINRNTTVENVVATAANPNKALPVGKQKNQNKTTRHFLYMSQKAYHLPDGTHGAAVAVEPKKHPMTVLECMGPIVSKLSARPTSLQSAAHKALTLQVRRRTAKRAKIAEIVTKADPEAEKAKRIAMKNDMIKEEMGKAGAGGSSARKGRSGTTGRRRTGLHSRGRNYDDTMSEEEEEDRFDSINIGAMKRRAKDTEEVLDYGDSEDEEEWEKSRSWKNQRNKSRRTNESDDEEENDEVFQEESEEEEEEVAPIRAKNKKSKIGVLDDDEDED